MDEFTEIEIELREALGLAYVIGLGDTLGLADAQGLALEHCCNLYPYYILMI